MSERKPIYLCLAHMSEEGIEQKYVKEAFDSNWVVPMGPNVNAFEADLANMANSKLDGSEPLDRKVVCLSAGTAAVHLALIACGVKAGDEVVCFGSCGRDSITPDDWAMLKGTHAYDIICSLGSRVQRVVK